MKPVIISMQSQWVKKILNGEKTIEIRKTKPSCDLPIKVYIYCTRAKPYLYRVNDDDEFGLTNKLRFPEDCFVKDYNAQNGKVVGEFTLNKVDTIEICDPYVLRNGEQEDWWWFKSNACLNCEEIMEYIGYGCDFASGGSWDKGYAWHIDNLKIYDKPKELGEFRTKCDVNFCSCCPYGNFKFELDLDYFKYVCKDKGNLKPLKRPPQSWCYVEKEEELKC